jgi:hypothetical protein
MITKSGTGRIAVRKMGLLMLAGVMFAITGVGAPTQEDLRESAARIHQVVWSRMIDSDTGVLFDYTDLDGKVEIPTPEECLAGKPNALGWWTPIENGAFFNGLYIDALCSKWQRESLPETKAEIRKLVSGLLLLQQIGTRPGFIARGVSTDGVTHHPIGSDDQTFPWFYGLWKYLASGIPDAAEKAAITARMDLVARAVKELDWRMPCEAPYTIRGNWAAAEFNLAVRIVFVNRIMLELTGDEFWLQSLDEVSRFTFTNGLTRIEVIAKGDTEMQIHQTWTHSMSVAGLKEMLRLETDADRRQQYRAGLSRTGQIAAPFIGEYAKFQPDFDAGFSGDWRVMNTIYRPQPTVDDAVTLAMEQVKIMNAESPQSQQEKRYMMWPLFAAWIVLLSEDEALIDRKLPVIKTALMHYRWEKLHHSAFFVGENIFYAMPATQNPGIY